MIIYVLCWLILGSISYLLIGYVFAWLRKEDTIKKAIRGKTDAISMSTLDIILWPIGLLMCLFILPYWLACSLYDEDERNK